MFSSMRAGKMTFLAGSYLTQSAVAGRSMYRCRSFLCERIGGRGGERAEQAIDIRFVSEDEAWKLIMRQSVMR